MPVYNFTSDNSGADDNNNIKNKEVQNQAIDPNSDLIETEINNSDSECLGYKIFCKSDKSNEYVPQRIAISCKKISLQESNAIKNKYAIFSAFGEGTLFTLISTVETRNNTVFIFNSFGNEVALSSINAEVKKANAEIIFKSAVKALDTLNSAFAIQNRAYIPLKCICEQTVFVQKTANGGFDFSKIKILPIITISNDVHTDWLPSDAFNENASIKTDIFSIGIMFRRIAGADNNLLNNSITANCYSVFVEDRPEISQLMELFTDNEYKNDNHHQEIEKSSENRQPAYKETFKIKTPSFIKNLYRKVFDFINPIIKKVKEIFDNNDRGGTM